MSQTTRNRLRTALVLVLALVALFFWLRDNGYLDRFDQPRSTSSEPAAAAARLTRSMTVSMTEADARAKLASLRVAADSSMDGYSRSQFRHWLDASSNGWPVQPSDQCDSRESALFYDGDGVSVGSSCSGLIGSWLDPYTGERLAAPGELDIDHMVPLAAAWRSGASSWTPALRNQYANDPLVLVSTEAGANRAKGDKGPELWVPPNKASHCLYANRWVQVKAKYGLSVNPDEKTALGRMLDTCAANPIPDGTARYGVAVSAK